MYEIFYLLGFFNENTENSIDLNNKNKKTLINNMYNDKKRDIYIFRNIFDLGFDYAAQ